MNIKSNRIMEEQKKELNLVEILKDCPKGTKLYTIYGEVVFERVDHYDGVIYPICFYEGENLQCVTKNGLHLVEHDGECSLFPSKDNHDWSTFKAPKPKWNPDTLQPFDKVLVRDIKGTIWEANFFLFINNSEDYPYHGIADVFKFCIPYNDDTKHLLGTTDEEPEYYRL